MGLGVLAKTGAMTYARGMMYKEVYKLMLLYVSKSWVVTGVTLNVLEGFHHRVARHITGMMETHGAGGEWEYPLVVAAMEAKLIHPIIENIRKRQVTI